MNLEEFRDKTDSEQKEIIARGLRGTTIVRIGRFALIVSAVCAMYGLMTYLELQINANRIASVVTAIKSLEPGLTEIEYSKVFDAAFPPLECGNL
ncbi:hypothetical protein [Thaumasiovibrio sp. DFM-14]|uniref:hypothetical protein n=1 Tax=Thaumasiovibrio sp. DFM-14 TaxID=3384792 RepID=UPI0039A348D0